MKIILSNFYNKSFTPNDIENLLKSVVFEKEVLPNKNLY